MIKIVTFIRRNPEMSHEEFVDYWKNVHAPLCKNRMPGLRKYTGSFPTGDATGLSEPDYDGIIDLYFDSVEAMRAALTSPEFMIEERLASSAKVMNQKTTDYLIVEEVEIPL